jgi:hypothetical protein
VQLKRACDASKARYGLSIHVWKDLQMVKAKKRVFRVLRAGLGLRKTLEIRSLKFRQKKLKKKLFKVLKSYTSTILSRNRLVLGQMRSKLGMKLKFQLFIILMMNVTASKTRKFQLQKKTQEFTRKKQLLTKIKVLCS